MVINSPCLTDKKELAIPGQKATGKEFSNPLMADSLPKTILLTKISKIDCLLSSEVLFEGRLMMSIMHSSMIEKICKHSDRKVSNNIGNLIGVGDINVPQVWWAPEKVGVGVLKELGDRWKGLPPTALALKQSRQCPMIHPSQEVSPGSDEGSKKLNELTELYAKLSKKVTSLEQDLKQTKQVYGKALTKLVKKVKHLEDQLKSTTKRRKAKVVISDEEEDLVSEDPSKQGRMSKTKYEHTFKSYIRRRSTDSLKVSTAGDIFSTAENILSSDARIAQELNEEELVKATARKEQIKIIL
ncbi:hypothetical protein Tco_0104758 [Tanacetum coccineum]